MPLVAERITWAVPASQGAASAACLPAVPVPRAAPQVHDLAPVPVDGHRRAALTAPREVGHEGVPDRLEAVLDRALDVHH